MKSKDQIKLEQIYTQVVNELFTGLGLSEKSDEVSPEDLEAAGYDAISSSGGEMVYVSPKTGEKLAYDQAKEEYLKDKKEPSAEEEVSEEPSEEEAPETEDESDVEKQAENTLSPEAPEEGISDSEMDLMSKLINQEG